jgi:alpha-L-rhamnosidase
MNLEPQDQRASAARILAQDIRDRGMKLSTGFLGTPYLLDVLADACAWDEVVGLLLQTAYPSWGYMPSVGATTVWERWNGDVGDLSMNSYNHYAFGAVVGFFYRRLGGVAPAAPGFRRINVKPLWFAQAGNVAARYDSIVGPIATSIEGDAEGLSRFSITVPANCTALVDLPDGTWAEGEYGIDDHPYIGTVYRQAETIGIELGSGDYAFTRR